MKFLGDRLILATAPLAMAHGTGAVILPMYTHRVGPSRYEVTFGPPLEVPVDANGNADYAGCGAGLCRCARPVRAARSRPMARLAAQEPRPAMGLENCGDADHCRRVCPRKGHGRLMAELVRLAWLNGHSLRRLGPCIAPRER